MISLSQFLRQQLENNGVPCVPSVLKAQTPVFQPIQQNTATKIASVSRVPNNSMGTHQHTHAPCTVFPASLAENLVSKGTGTPRTRRTPDNNITLDIAVLQVEFAERSAIAEYDGGLPKEIAEQYGLSHVLTLIAEGDTHEST